MNKFNSQVTMSSVTKHQVKLVSGFTEQIDPYDDIIPTDQTSVGSAAFTALVRSDMNYVEVCKLQKEVAELNMVRTELEERFLKLEMVVGLQAQKK